MYIEHVGTMTVKNCQTGMVCPIEFRAQGWHSSAKHEVTGKVLDKDQKQVGTISGKWSEQLTYKLEKSAEEHLLWKCNSMPEKHDWQYHFTNYTMNLNHLPESLKPKLPRTDSRFRPD